MGDETWTEIHRRRRNYGGKWRSNDQFPKAHETTFFVNNLPDGVSETNFRELFKCFGNLSDAYVARKRDKGAIFSDPFALGIYNKWGSKQELPVGRESARVENRRRTNEFLYHSAGVSRSPNGQFSYKDAVMGNSLPNKIRHPPIEIGTLRFWKDYSLMGVTKDLITLDSIVDILEGLGLNGEMIRAEKWFRNIDQWKGQEYAFERVATLRVYGDPGMAWDARIFNLIGENYGQILHESSATPKDCNLSYDKILILTSKMGRVCEEEEDWCPTFLVNSPENVDRCRKVSNCSFGHCERAWELNGRNDDEREEGEIFEKNQAEYNSNAAGEAQNLAPPACEMATRNTRVGRVAEFGSNNHRPKKRSRVNSDVFEGEFSDSGIPNRDGLDIPFLNPDLNLPPPVNNRKIRQPEMGSDLVVEDRQPPVLVASTVAPGSEELPVAQVAQSLHNEVVATMEGRSGGLLSIWDPDVFKKHGVSKGDHFLHVYGSVVGIDEPLNIVNIYAPQNATSKRLNSEFDNHGARVFHDFIHEARLHEYRMSSMKFTYMSADGTKFSKIDRFLVCNQFYHRWPDAIVMAHDRLWSDHSPITLTMKSLDFGPSPFKFYTSWLSIPGIDDIVRRAAGDCELVGTPDVTFLAKLRCIKYRLKEWLAASRELSNA
ncbi:hypothetical protein E3N88_12382 [Mikania micrantha]|uniref:RRM domain-containing protein n=1 Tax=Mikania micrantha TaxID=192012 RepID=A0A5N6P7C9_9ASTR|nr:hypothetical protein E3N88_12382 [Mikania micrantha]